MRTSIYLPDDLAEHVRAHGISISQVAQTALRKAVQPGHRRLEDVPAAVRRACRKTSAASC